MSDPSLLGPWALCKWLPVQQCRGLLRRTDGCSSKAGRWRSACRPTAIQRSAHHSYSKRANDTLWQRITGPARPRAQAIKNAITAQPINLARVIQPPGHQQPEREVAIANAAHKRHSRCQLCFDSGIVANAARQQRCCQHHSST